MQYVKQFLCKQCPSCQGFGCIDELPGMGGVQQNKNFQLNCQGWNLLREYAKREKKIEALDAVVIKKSNIYSAPVTGSEQNIGFECERDFYEPYVFAAHKAGIGFAIGDGVPDDKLQYGIGAVEAVKRIDPSARAAVFLKPYSNNVLFERIDWCKHVARIIGNDIDAYNIATMRNLAHLEKKTARALAEIRAYAGLPYAVKGVFTQSDIELVKELLPDIVVVSNHGGRVETATGSTAQFLFDHAATLKNYCGEVWVDGGIRTSADVKTALYFGADKVMIARPLIIALVAAGEAGMIKTICEIALDNEGFEPPTPWV